MFLELWIVKLHRDNFIKIVKLSYLSTVKTEDKVSIIEYDSYVKYVVLKSVMKV